MAIPHWTALRDAMHAGIVAASGLDASRVIWKFQQGGQPEVAYIAITVSGTSNPGQDGLLPSTDLDRPAGQEVELAVVGFRECTLGLEIFTPSVADDSDALALGERIRTKLRLPSVRDGLGAAGISPFDVGGVQYVPSVVNTTFRGRGLLDIRCYVPAEPLADFVGFIASVGGTVKTSGGGVAGTNTRTFSAP